MRSRRYGSDLTDAQWEVIAPLLAGHRPIKHHPRHVLDALLYLAKTGCQWRYLPDTYPPWQTVYYHFRRWAERGLLTRLLHRLRRAVRRKAGRDAEPLGRRHRQPVGQDEPRRRASRLRRREARRRAQASHPRRHARAAARRARPPRRRPRQPASPPSARASAGGGAPARIVFADEGYAATPAGLIWRVFGWRWSLVRRERPGFVVLPKRWVVERTFAWFGGYRRLAKDYERLCSTSEAMVQLSTIRMMVRRLA